MKILDVEDGNNKVVEGKVVPSKLRMLVNKM